MKVTDESLCVICNSKGYRDHQIFHAKENIRKHPDMSNLLLPKVIFHNEVGFRTLVLSQQSIMNLEHYLVPKNIRMDLLRSLPNRKDIIQVGENCYKYIKTDETLTVICLKHGTLDGGNGTFTVYFSIDLLTGNVVSDEYDYLTKEEVTTEQKLIELYYSKFMVVVTYLELTEVELKIVFSKGKSSQSFGSNVLKNDTKKSVIHVTSDWNIEKIIVGTFGVRSHMRCISTDRTRTKFKYVQVKSYTKNLIMRNPQKELVC